MITKKPVKNENLYRSISFSPPDISQREIDEVINVLKSGWITTGPKTKEFEKGIASVCNTGTAVCLNSNTSCLELTLRLFGIGPGDEVIVPAYTYTASASVIAHVGAKIVMIDCAKDSFCFDYEKLEMAINDRTKAIIPVDLFGIPCDYDKIFEIVNRKQHIFHPSNNELQKAIDRIVVIADSAHAFGASYKGSNMGSVADFTNFSFHAVKNLTTAEGGAVTWRDIEGIENEKIYKEYMLMSLHGQSKDAFTKEQVGSWEYDIVDPWYKCNMTDLNAAIGVAQLSRYDEMLIKRRNIIQKYNQGFEKTPVKFLKHFDESYISSGHIYGMRINGYTVEQRNEFIIRMGKRGVPVNVHYKPLPMHTGYKKLGFDINDFPNAFKQYENMVSLPLHTMLTDDEVQYIIECVKMEI